MTKKASQRAHFKKRAAERFGLSLTAKQVREISASIKHQRKGIVFISAGSSNRCSIWDVEYEGVVLRVVYDKQRHTVVTALPNSSAAAV